MLSEPGGPVPTDGLDPAQVLAALDRVLASVAFRRSSRSRALLAYVVTETLAGRADRLSERTVGRRALGRGPEFDGAESSAVRVAGSRVRKALDRYYTVEGAEDPVRISLPPGAYVPRFHGRPAHPADVAVVPGVAVVELEATRSRAARAVAASLTQTLVNRLAEYRDIRLVGPTSLSGDVRATGGALGVSSVLQGRVVDRDGLLHVSVRLHSTITGEVLWSADDALARGDLGGVEVEEGWARSVAALLGDATGLVVRHELASPQHDTEPELAARLAFYAYVDRGSTESVHEAAERLDAALASGTRSPALLAMRAAVANASVAYGIGDEDAQLDLAAALAREALTFDGRNVHAYLVLASVERGRGHWDLAVQHAETAVRLAPYQPSYLAGAGMTIMGAGRWDEGAELIREAQRLHPGLAAHMRTWLAIGHLVHGDHDRALAEASLLPSDGGFVWGPLYRAMALAGLGYVDQARTELALAAETRPDIVADPGSWFAGRMRLTPDQLDHLVALVDAARATD